MWRSSSVPITQKDLSSSRTGGSSNERSHGSGGAGVSPKIGRISIARRSHFCASLQSGSCSENYEIPRDLSGQTLSLEPPHTPDRFPALHQLECVGDLGQRHHMGDHRIDFDLAPHVPVDDL